MPSLHLFDRAHKLRVLDERSIELAAWEASTRQRALLIAGTYFLAFVAIALFLFMDVVYSVWFTPAENRVYLLKVLASLVIGEGCRHRHVQLWQAVAD